MFRPHCTIIREHVDPSQSYHWPLIFTLHFGAAEACLYEVLGYVCIPLSMCILRCYVWYLVRYTFGAAEACWYEVLGYVRIPLSVCILRCYAWYQHQSVT
jgi:hypothetical protein